jgi:hypothetical protein
MNTNKYVPFKKLSKKRQGELNRLKRLDWGPLNPVTRKPPNPKAYDRQKARRESAKLQPPGFPYAAVGGRGEK